MEIQNDLQQLLLEEVTRQKQRVLKHSSDRLREPIGRLPPPTADIRHEILDDNDKSYHSALCAMEKQLKKSTHPEDLLSIGHGLLDMSVVWKVPALCGEGRVISQDLVIGHVKRKFRSDDEMKRILSNRVDGVKNAQISNKEYIRIDDIWNEDKIVEWESSTSSSLVIVEGSSQSLKRLERFGVSVVEHMSKTQHVVHLLSPMPTSTPSLTENDALRQLSIQCLQILSLSQVQISQNYLARMVTHFQSGGIENWFAALKNCFDTLQCPVCIVVNTQALGKFHHEASQWSWKFGELCQQYKDSARINVMIISGRRLNATAPTILISNSAAPLNNAKMALSQSLQMRSSRTPTSVLSKCPRNDDKLSKALLPQDGIEGVSTQRQASKLEVHGNAILKDQENKVEKAKTSGKFQSAEMDQSARGWFDKLEDTHEAISDYENLESAPIQPVKIAVLDTGFAYHEPKDKRLLKPYKYRIAKIVDFVGDPDDNIAATKDSSGHGTAVAVQIMKTSLMAVLYICRVAKMSDNGFLIPDKTAVEKAIKKAAGNPEEGGWGVDIINMSFGWDYDDDDGVRDAIRFARKQGVHMFAATSNDGLLGPPNNILYPSRASEVIAIDVADGFGNYERQTAAVSIQGKERRFSAPGVGLSSPNSDRVWSGSSFSCGIAAGVCALILEFARQPPLNASPTFQAILQEMSTMTALLRLMSAEKGSEGFRFLLPWNVIGKRGERRKDTGYIIVRCLRDEFGIQLGEEVYPLRG